MGIEMKTSHKIFLGLFVGIIICSFVACSLAWTTLIQNEKTEQASETDNQIRMVRDNDALFDRQLLFTYGVAYGKGQISSNSVHQILGKRSPFIPLK